jgi:hypothetical protein
MDIGLIFNSPCILNLRPETQITRTQNNQTDIYYAND